MPRPRFTGRCLSRLRAVVLKRFVVAVWRRGAALKRFCEGWSPRAIALVDHLLRQGDRLANRLPRRGELPYKLRVDWAHYRSEFRGLRTRAEIIDHEATLRAARHSASVQRGGLGLSLAGRVPILLSLIATMSRQTTETP